MAAKLDVKDRKILYQLDVDARQSNIAIAKKTRLNKDAVGYRIKRLEKQRVIRGYRAIIDSSRLGFLFYRIYFKLMDIQPERRGEFLNFLRDQKNIWWIARLDGTWDLIFAVWVRSDREFAELYHQLSLRFRECIKEQLICPMLSYNNVSRKYLFDGKENTITSVGGGEKEHIDETDVKILRFLAENARTSLVEIAQLLGIDSMTVHHRIKKLEKKKIIQGYKVDLDARMLGRDFYSVKINLKDVSQIATVKTYLYTIPELTATTEAIGSYDVEFDLEVDSSERYFEILEDIETRFDFIREIVYFRVLKNYKILYLPEM